MESTKAGIATSTSLFGKVPGVEHIVRRALTDEVLATWRKAIVAGAFAPGDHLTETRLAGQLGVSRVPVREAMMVLEREGLLEFDERGAAPRAEFHSGGF